MVSWVCNASEKSIALSPNLANSQGSLNVKSQLQNFSLRHFQCPRAFYVYYIAAKTSANPDQTCLLCSQHSLRPGDRVEVVETRGVAGRARAWYLACQPTRAAQLSCSPSLAPRFHGRHPHPPLPPTPVSHTAPAAFGNWRRRSSPSSPPLASLRLAPSSKQLLADTAQTSGEMETSWRRASTRPSYFHFRPRK